MPDGQAGGVEVVRKDGAVAEDTVEERRKEAESGVSVSGEARLGGAAA